MPVPVPLRRQRPLRWLGPAALHATKTALASGLSWFIAANVLGNNIPVFAPLAAVLTVQVTVWESVSRGLQRVLGVVVGVLVAYSFARLAGINAWSIALIVFVSMLAGRALHLGQQGSIQVPVSALLVLVLGATTHTYAADRVVDTAIGAALGSLVNLVIVPRTHLDDAQGAVRDLAGALAALLRDVATELVAPADGPSAHLERARQLSVEASTTEATVRRTETATRWNPAGHRDRPAVENLHAALKTLERIERPARGIARALVDAPAGWHLAAGLAQPLAALLSEVAGELDDWAARATSGGAGAAGGTGAAGGSQSPAVSMYRAVLAATWAPQTEPEAAAVASAIALDANRISDELRAEPDIPPPARFGLQTLFGP